MIARAATTIARAGTTIARAATSSGRGRPTGLPLTVRAVVGHRGVARATVRPGRVGLGRIGRTVHLPSHGATGIGRRTTLDRVGPRREGQDRGRQARVPAGRARATDRAPAPVRAPAAPVRIPARGRISARAGKGPLARDLVPGRRPAVGRVRGSPIGPRTIAGTARSRRRRTC